MRGKRRSSPHLLFAWPSALVVLVALVQGASGAGHIPCYFPNEGASYGKSYANVKGLQSLVDHVNPGTQPNGTAIVHPSQIGGPDGVEFVGWGTARGEGTSVPGALSNCPDDYTNWNIYVDGVSFGKYFCRQQYGSLGYTAQDNYFRIEYGLASACDNANAWRFYMDGVYKTCQRNAASYGVFVAVGSEVIGTTSTLTADVHWGSLGWKSGTTGNWNWWGAGSTCENAGYQVRKITNYDVWTERQ